MGSCDNSSDARRRNLQQTANSLFFSRPERSINQGRISEIEANHERYDGIGKASRQELSEFLADWEKIRFPIAPKNNSGPAHPETLKGMFPLRNGHPQRLDVSETSLVEGKESFDWGSKHKYCKTLAAMANNMGGYILFGVKDGSFEVVGIRHDRMERFDLRKANEYIVRNFNQSLELDKGQFEIDGKTVGALYVHPAKSKPVICTFDSGDLKSGDIYYRYSGESRRIQAPELDRLLKERDKIADSRILQMMAKLSETGIENSALINLGTGEVEGQKGKFLIDEELLDKVKFISQGKLVEKDGAPTLRVVGDVQPVGSGKITIQQSVVGSISERHIHEAFLYQRCQYDPTAYIRAQTHLQPVWLPIYFFALHAGFDKNALTECLKKSESPYQQRVKKQIERIKSGNPPTGCPSREMLAKYISDILSDEPVSIETELEAKKYLQSIRLLKPDEIELEKALSLLTDLRARFGNSRSIRSVLRYAIAAVDVNWFAREIK
ncbi:MAG: ATP-binding protein [Cohaesibacter sp.]|jgi:hypothetical protein|nr:ATP-binding protein [Cohaesibacter sp.]